ncbi:MAG: penicillin-binding protein 2 [Deltaproteobacteria bacterium]|nr:MAG: penicillin-binding protein 2 [Deltaproteobacteria bacterium]
MMQHRNTDPRIGLILFCFFVAGGIVVGRVVYLQFVEGTRLTTLIEQGVQAVIDVQPRRGSIYNNRGQEIALSVLRDSIYARASEVKDPVATARLLAEILDEDDFPTYLRRLRSRKGFVWIKRQISPEESDRLDRFIGDERLAGVERISEYQRVYPHGQLLAHILGFTNIDSTGIEGLERRYDSCLAGKAEQHVVARDARGVKIFREEQIDSIEPTYGCDLVLTIDQEIQYQAEEALRRQVEATDAKGGVAIVADPNTGRILAMANQPAFDPNDFSHFPPESYRNRSITDNYEPGSTFKTILVAAAIEKGIVTPEDRFFCENGRYRFARRTIHDAHPHGELTVSDIIKFSSNIGVTKIAQRLGPEEFFEFIRAFGFGTPTGIDLGAEAQGLLRPQEKWAEIDLATHAFGQGISVTPLQLLMAYCAVANGGKLLRPFVVAEIRDHNGHILEAHYPKVVRRVISERTAQSITKMLEGVVDRRGTGRRAAIPGYRVAGKTGTAQKVEPGGRGYSPTARVASFVGFAPAQTPRLAALVVIDEPQGPQHSKYGGVVAAPVWREIMEMSLRHLGILPTRQEEEAPAKKEPESPQFSGL